MEKNHNFTKILIETNSKKNEISALGISPQPLHTTK